jgi:2-polyprenyl-6-methoxyphenol hydroxylase-like FAD-dependent oxidoreductase
MGPALVRVAVVGGGPGGLFLATLPRRANPSAEVTVFERNRAGDTFGFGVVFSDRTLAGIHAADPVLREALERHGRHWDQIEVPCSGCWPTAPRKPARRCTTPPRSGWPIWTATTWW